MTDVQKWAIRRNLKQEELMSDTNWPLAAGRNTVKAGKEALERGEDVSVFIAGNPTPIQIRELGFNLGVVAATTPSGATFHIPYTQLAAIVCN